MIVDVAGYTNVGLVRSTNQDSILIRASKNRGLFVVADGMGGHSGGDYASQSTINSIAAWWDEAEKTATTLDELVYGCQQEIINISNYIYDQFKSAGLVGGTTIVAVIVDGDRFATLSVGDSHIYRYENNNMVPLGVDDVWENLPSTLESMTPEQIATDSRRGKLTAAIGAIPNVNVRVEFYNQMDEEYLMLCSDGIYKYCGPEQLVGGFVAGLTSRNSQTTVATLANHVLNNGANDNFTLAICRLSKFGGLKYEAPADLIKGVKEPNCDMKVMSEIYESQSPLAAPATPVTVAAPVATAQAATAPAVTAVPEEKSQPVKEEKPLNLNMNRKTMPDMKIIIMIAAAVIALIIIGVAIAKSGKKDKKDPATETDAVIETTVPTTQTTVPVETDTTVETFNAVTTNVPLIIKGTASEVNTTAISSNCVYYGDFDGDGVKDGIEIAFTETEYGVEPVLVFKDANGVVVSGPTSLKDIVNLQYSESDVVGLLSELNSKTALFITVVNYEGKDNLVAYYAGNGLSGNKIVSIIGIAQNNFNLINMYSNISGSMQVMYPITGGDSSLSPVDQMCRQHLGMDYDNVGQEEIDSCSWKLGTQLVGIVYN
ncbi:MAG: serine/threonine-protein phosphatase [Saccharofermentans sp.]|nr:serine/threonine-protein phosphatase [Saccharofermentans sp.]